MWLAASLKFLLPFSLLFALGGRLHLQPVAQTIATPQVYYAVGAVVQPFSAQPEPPPPDAKRADRTPVVIFALWGCGALALAAIRFRQWLRIRAGLRYGKTLDIGSPIEVLSCPGAIEPGVFGVLRPVMLLPEGIAGHLAPAQLEAVLAHELCHVRRHDNLSAALHMLVETAFWFHPFVWWIGARLVEERERACDEGVLSLGGEPRTYADAILNVCRHYLESPLVCVSGVTGGGIRRRIEVIMESRIGRSLSRGRRLLLAAAGIAAVAGPVAIGAIIAAGNAPPVFAHPRALFAALAPGSIDAASPAQTPELASRTGRKIAILLDWTSMTPDECARSKQTALNYISSKLAADDLAAVMEAGGAALDGEVRVIQDFTSDNATLRSAITNSSPAGGSDSNPDGTARLAHVERASQILQPIAGDKMLVYISSGAPRFYFGDARRLRDDAIAMLRDRIAFYAISTFTLDQDARPVASIAAVLAPPRPGSQNASDAAAPAASPDSSASGAGAQPAIVRRIQVGRVGQQALHIVARPNTGADTRRAPGYQFSVGSDVADTHDAGQPPAAAYYGGIRPAEPGGPLEFPGPHVVVQT